MHEETGQSDASGAVTAAAAERASWWNVLGWAAYLACSWTWCIGMFLPVLLVRDYGVWGFVVFAVPNVVGAGAMGWVLKQGAAERIVERHRAACVAFSIVTIAFQCFFLAWIPLKLLDRLESRTPLEAGWVSMWSVVAACILAVICLAFQKRAAAGVIACIVLGMSIWAGVSLGLGPAGAAWETEDAQRLASAFTPDLLLLAPVCVFGFALCPYLDLTFHRARQALPAVEARTAFSVGFGVLFLSMILITLLVAPLVLGLLGMMPAGAARWLGVWPLLLHLLLQLTFTVCVHTRELSRIRRGMLAAGAVVAAIGITWLCRGSLGIEWHGMTIGEIVYRCFMSFYGLIFPAYVWLCMIPTADGHSGIGGERGRWKLVVLGVACAVSAPCYWMGFIERVEWWLAPGLGVVLVARLLVRGRASDAISTST